MFSPSDGDRDENGRCEVDRWFVLDCRLKFRISKGGVARDISSHEWETSLFTETRHCLPGVEEGELVKEVTYPRFVNVGNELLFTYRTGQ